jgi:hypothetical protein
MVQIVDPKRRSSRSDYWKLDHGPRTKQDLLSILEPKGRAYKSTSVAHLRVLYSHYQRGLLSYEGLRASELETFISQQALPPRIDKRPTVSNLKRLLELADDDATFDRFLDLPPELRQQIYDHYFDSFVDSPRPVFGQPPITIISKQTRQEALLLFYHRYRFALKTDADVDDGRRLNRNAVDFLRNTSAENIARIRFLTLECDAEFNFPYWYFIAFEININNDPCSVKISTFNYDDHSDRFFGKSKTTVINEVNKLLMLEPHAMIRSIAAREGALKLQKNDISLLYDSLWRALQQGLGKLP